MLRRTLIKKKKAQVDFGPAVLIAIILG